MIPTQAATSIVNFDFGELPDRTFKLHQDNKTISGYIDNIESLKQAINLILGTERYKYIIYSWNYGAELEDLIGKPISFALPEIKKRITEALLQDTRIYGVKDFKFETGKNLVHVAFIVNTVYGEIAAEKEVKV